MGKKKHAEGLLRSVETGWSDTLMICRKCGKKLAGGFGEDGDLSLRQALRGALRAAGLRGRFGILDAGCFGICPKRAVVMAVASRPAALLVVPEGMSDSRLAELLPKEAVLF